MENMLTALELYDYLVTLKEKLTSVGASEAAQSVERVSQFISGSTSELFGEARITLPMILAASGDRLDVGDREALESIIASIEEVLVSIGGA